MCSCEWCINLTVKLTTNVYIQKYVYNNVSVSTDDMLPYFIGTSPTGPVIVQF